MKNSMGGVKPSPPLSTRTDGRLNPKVTRYNPYTILDPHEKDNWHRVRTTGIPSTSWGVYRIRRKRVGQLSLFDPQWQQKGKGPCKAS